MKSKNAKNRLIYLSSSLNGFAKGAMYLPHLQFPVSSQENWFLTIGPEYLSSVGWTISPQKAERTDTINIAFCGGLVHQTMIHQNLFLS